MSEYFIGILTCERPVFLRRLLDSISFVDKKDIFIVDDSKNCDEKRSIHKDELPEYNWESTTGREGCAKAKNIIIRKFLASNKKYLFIVEDDMIVLQNTVFDRYIEVANENKLHHLLYALHEPTNKKLISKRICGHQTDYYMPNAIGSYGTDVLIYANCCGSFAFYTRECINLIGEMDENFYNTLEHVEHTYRICQSCLTTPFWAFPDVINSIDLIDEQATVNENSVTKNDTNYNSHLINSWNYFKNKYGIFVNQIPRPF